MSEIPFEVQMNAERLYDDGGYKSVPTIIAEAIMAERERCASVADKYGIDNGPKNNWDEQGRHVADAAEAISMIIIGELAQIEVKK